MKVKQTHNQNKKTTFQVTLRAILIAMLICLIPAFAAAADVDQASSQASNQAADQTTDQPINQAGNLPPRVIPNGHKHVDVEIHHGPGGLLDQERSMQAQDDSQIFPEKYDSRTQSWYQGFQVNDQGNTNLCWACAASEAAQISYAKETNGEQNIRTSPPQLGYYFYNRLDDPLRLTPGDANVSWFGDWVLEGGNLVNTFQHMTTWSGLVSYDDAPMTLDENDDYIGYGDWFGNPEGEHFPPQLAYDSNIMTLQNTIFYEQLDGNKAEDRNLIKALLMKYGGVAVSMEFAETYFADGDTSGVNYFHTDPFMQNNHEVVIMGWDDSYDPSNFRSATAKHPDQYTHQPSQPGAWIILNSWGDKNHDNGYFYASYESADILGDGVCAFDMQAPSDYKYNFQHDGNALNGQAMLDQDEMAANVFNAPFHEQVRLDAVGMTVWDDAAIDYQIQVYTGLVSPNEPDSGVLACTTSARTDSPGFKTIKLPKTVVVDPGEKYSIVVTCKSAESVIGYESAYDGEKGTYEASILPGESYVHLPGAFWFDVAADDICMRIKGLANESACQHDDQMIDVVDPTETEDGYTLYGCSECGHAYKTDLTLRQLPKPNPVTTIDPKAGKKCFTARWICQSQLLADNNISGYEIRYSPRKTMGGAKKVKVLGYEKEQKKIRKLKPRKTYYMKMRCFFLSPEDGQIYYSDWSNKLRVKTK